MNQILLIEDDLILGETLKEGLESHGFGVTWAKSCAQARQYLLDRGSPTPAFCLGILDVSLPDGSGFDLAIEIRKLSLFPFVFMTALNSAENRLTGYDLGAEEFIPKPFHFRELLIRLEHVLKTHHPKDEQQIELPSGTLDLRKMCFEQRSGETTFLSLKDFRMLMLLIRESPNPVSRDRILDLIWGGDQFPTQRTVDNCIVRLRQTIRDTDSQIIRSVRGMGYQWLGGKK